MELLPLFLSLAVGSLLGSWHCAAMCGPIACAITQKNGSLGFYHLGRMISYVAIGAVAGSIGSSLLQLPLPLRLSAFVLLAFFLSLQILPTRIKNKAIEKLPRLNSVKNSLFKKLPEKPWGVFLFGLASVTLPCGWLWTYLAAAAATASAFGGAVVMFILWLGSVPALSAMSIYFRKALSQNSLDASKQSRRRSLLVSWGLAFAGYYALISHFFIH